MELKFDHIIHYINQLNQFEFPGKLLKLHNGGKHHQFVRITSYLILMVIILNC